ncbi:signal peptide peptidase SppA [Natranaerobius trueperi]|uniref:Signal peptide peptidase SppA n=1 Tax=Natranaerobius trueperi TaxID=759412 RepID=A0A226C112_9FIRM|nr:signal peptide peptidase SppA [Natranaerobius trueperi]OWZ84060.1 signal peptide peptidase SppA [Natranaerobius trueperi]
MNQAEKSNLKMFLFKFLIVLVGITALILLGMFTMVFGLTSIISFFDSSEVDQEDLVQVIELDGQITETGNFNVDITPRLVRESLQQAKFNNAEAVILRVNSPGGTVAASQEIASVIDDFELPTVVSMADSATSGGYYISAAADSVKAHETTTTGSIGVISVIYNLEELYDTIGVEVEVIKSGEHKDIGYESLDEEERNILQNLSDEMYEHFVSEVSNYRDLPKEDVYEIATGEIMSGTRAYELDLVDGLGGLDEAVDRASELADIEEPNVQWLDTEGIWSGFMVPMIEDVTSLDNKDYNPKVEEVPSEFFGVEFRYQNGY